MRNTSTNFNSVGQSQSIIRARERAGVATSNLLVYLYKQSEWNHRGSTVRLVTEQLADHDHRLGEIGAEQTHRYGEELLHLAGATKSPDRDDRVEVPVVQTEAVPTMRDHLDGQRLVVI